MSAEQHHDYHLVDPSPWPILAAFAGLFLAVSALFFIHEKPFGVAMFYVAIITLITIAYLWWKDVVAEGVDGSHTEVVRNGLRLGMVLFITSEIMFFAAFFWAFFKAALDPVLLFEGGNIFEEGQALIRGIWPPQGIETFDAWDLPLLNTLILLLSGTTVTWAHYAIINNDRKGFIKGLAITVALGMTFTALQAYEYGHAAFGFTDGIYSSNFYMATGFHGAHVIIGTIFLAVCLWRGLKGQIDSEGHLGFEFAAWYWHFVDVVWLFLFAFVYVWGA